MPYKNVETLVKALKFLPEFELHLLSKITPARQTELSNLAKGIGGKVVFHNGVSDEEYVSILDDAFALVSASKDEGFGIPLVEAMQRGTPVVVSDLEIFHEVAASAGSYFNPDDAEELANKVIELGADWAKQSKAAIAQAENFDWDQSAEALLKLFS
jgi:glycosyltransferase involved in cell wall biosynthesis